MSADRDPTPPEPPLDYARPNTPQPPLESDEPETWADVLRAMNIVAGVLVALFLVIAMVCGGLL